MSPRISAMEAIVKARTMCPVCAVLWNKKFCIIPVVFILIGFVLLLQNQYTVSFISNAVEDKLPLNLKLLFNDKVPAQQKDNLNIVRTDSNQKKMQDDNQEKKQEDNQEKNQGEQDDEKDDDKNYKMADGVVKEDEIKERLLKDYKILPNASEIDSWGSDQLAFVYSRYTKRLQYSCKRLMGISSSTVYTWKMCYDQEFQPNKKCLVYSFGLTDVTPVEVYLRNGLQCVVHYFQPTAKVKASMIKSGVNVHATGLSAQNGRTESGWRVRTLFTLMEENGHKNRTIDILKIDMDKWEWQALPELVKSGVLKQVTQLLLAIHATTEPSLSDYREHLKLFQLMYAMNFRIANIVEKEDTIVTQLNDKLSKEIEMLFLRIPNPA